MKPLRSSLKIWKSDEKDFPYKQIQGEPLDEKFQDHKFTGNYVGTRECLIEPDWLLIFEDHDDELVLIRTGTHSDLFG